MRNVGEYQVTYTITDAAGNSDSKTRTVKVIESVPPIIVLNNLLYQDPITTLNVNRDEYQEYNATAYDLINGTGLPIDLTNQIVISGDTVDTTKLGTYTVTYSVTDWSGNKSSVNRVIRVVDKTGPDITLSSTERVNVSYKYWGKTKTISVPKGIANDNLDGDVSSNVKIEASESLILGVWVHYYVSDSHSNASDAWYNYNDIK
jgi:hypothetical protein